MEFEPKIVFTDIDGTLLDKHRGISPATNAAVGKLTERGIPFILISSRMPRAMTHLQADLSIVGAPLIAYNGGLVLDGQGKTLSSQAILLPVAKHIAQTASALELVVMLYHIDEWYVTEREHYAQREENNTRTEATVQPLATTLTDWEDRNIGAHKVMVMGDPGGIDTLVQQLTKFYGDQLHLYRSKDDYLEIADAQISKLTGVKTLLEACYPNLTPADCVAFGDNYNDVEMLEGVGLGVAVANARKEVKAVADMQVAGNKEDGVAEGLNKIFTQRQRTSGPIPESGM